MVVSKYLLKMWILYGKAGGGSFLLLPTSYLVDSPSCHSTETMILSRRVISSGERDTNKKTGESGNDITIMKQNSTECG